MKLLLDQGLPRSAAARLREMGIEVVHVGELGMATSNDEQIMDYAAEQRLVIVTLDADFHAMLARRRAAGPSVIRIRIEGLKGPGLASMLVKLLPRCAEAMEHGAIASITSRRMSIRRLPIE